MTLILPVEDKHPQFGNNCFMAPNATIVLRLRPPPLLSRSMAQAETSQEPAGQRRVRHRRGPRPHPGRRASSPHRRRRLLRANAIRVGCRPTISVDRAPVRSHCGRDRLRTRIQFRGHPHLACGVSNGLATQTARGRSPPAARQNGRRADIVPAPPRATRGRCQPNGGNRIEVVEPVSESSHSSASIRLNELGIGGASTRRDMSCRRHHADHRPAWQPQTGRFNLRSKPPDRNDAPGQCPGCLHYPRH